MLRGTPNKRLKIEIIYNEILNLYEFYNKLFSKA